MEPKTDHHLMPSFENPATTQPPVPPEKEQDIAPHEVLPAAFPNIHKEAKVDESVRKLRREGEKVPETKAGRIDAHFARIDRALEKKPGLFMRQVKAKLLREHTLDILDEEGKEDEGKMSRLVQGLFESDKEILRRRGLGAEAEEYGDRPRPEHVAKYQDQLREKRAAQARGLEDWINYLGGPDGSAYPTWFKYLALRSLMGMGKRIRGSEATETEPEVKPSYTKRSKTTIQPFPALDRGALGATLDAIKERVAKGIEEKDQETTDIQKLADKGDFARLYAHFQDENERIRRERELKEGTKGTWKRFKIGDTTADGGAEEMVAALKGKGTEWCIEGREVASNFLNADGEFHIYFTEDDTGTPADPRVAIRLEQGSIAEVRGVLDREQNMEPQFTDIARERYKGFEGAERFEKIDRDMKLLTKIEEKMKRDQDLTAKELRFLYGLEGPIEGFGYGQDPRVDELRARRDPKEDAPLVFGCQPNDIAWGEAEAKKRIAEAEKSGTEPDLKAYVGPLFLGMFKQLGHLEHLFTSFPEGRIVRRTMDLPGKTGEEHIAAIEALGDIVYAYAKAMLRRPEFAARQETGPIETVQLIVRGMGAKSNQVKDIFERAKELGLELCPPEVGPALRETYREQPNGEYVYIGMEPITDPAGYPCVFDVYRGDDGDRWLNYDDAWPYFKWDGAGRVVFRLRK